MITDLFEIQREQALVACEKMSEFYHGLNDLYRLYGMDLETNRGRRNILMSAPMEHFLAQALNESGLYNSVSNDGRTGQADIVLGLSCGEEI